MLRRFWCTTSMYGAVPQVTLEASANMCNSVTLEFELKFIQRGRFCNESFITFSLQIFRCRRRSFGILVSQSNPLLHNSWINNFIFTIYEIQRLENWTYYTKMPLFVSGTMLFETLNLSISIIVSQVIASTLSVSNSSWSELTTFDDKLSRDRFFKVIGLFNINVAKL